MDVIFEGLVPWNEIKRVNAAICDKLSEKFDYYNRKEERIL